MGRCFLCGGAMFLQPFSDTDLVGLFTTQMAGSVFPSRSFDGRQMLTATLELEPCGNETSVGELCKTEMLLQDISLIPVFCKAVVPISRISGGVMLIAKLSAVWRL